MFLILANKSTATVDDVVVLLAFVLNFLVIEICIIWLR